MCSRVEPIEHEASAASPFPSTTSSTMHWQTLGWTILHQRRLVASGTIVRNSAKHFAARWYIRPHFLVHYRPVRRHTLYSCWSALCLREDGPSFMIQDPPLPQGWVTAGGELHSPPMAARLPTCSPATNGARCEDTLYLKVIVTVVRF
jgi:hypothetical protein